MSVRDSSIEAYHELKSEGRISEKRSIAFNALKEYAEAEGTDRWPTKVELYEWAQGHLDSEEFPFSRFGNFKPRITELTPGSDATDIELVEYLDEKREQDSSTTDRSAHPVKILSYQSTLSSKEGEAAELKDEDRSSEPVSDPVADEELEIPYKIDGGNEVKMGPPLEAIEETDDLESVVEMLEKNDILEKYQEEVEGARSNSRNSEDNVDDNELIEKDGEDYVFDPDEESQAEEEEDLVSNDGGNDAKDSVSCSDETKKDKVNDDSEEEQEVFMEDGEVVV